MKRTITTALAVGVVAAAASLMGVPAFAHFGEAYDISATNGPDGKTTIKFYVNNVDMKAVKLNWCEVKHNLPMGAIFGQKLSTALCQTAPKHTGYGDEVETAPKNGFISSGWKQETISPALEAGRWWIGISLDNGDTSHQENGEHPALEMVTIAD